MKSRPPPLLHQRVTRRLQAIDARPADLARALGITDSAISQWSSRQSANLRPANLVAAADFLRCEIRWLATGDGPEVAPRPLSSDEAALLSSFRAIGEQDRATLLRMAKMMAADLPAATSAPNSYTAA
jgi:transcriptional regulator with XRE-family HTH domain